jgi:4-oxalocrotonate tautomerase
MPHVLIKLVQGKSEDQKNRLAEEITKDVIDILNYGEESVSVAFEEVAPQDWTETVYKPDIQGKWDTVHKKPGYNPFEE